MTNKTIELIKQKEGYRSKAYWDENAYRIGYGSDTMTDANGNVIPVTKNSTTTKEDAQRDLDRRVPLFQRNGIIKHVGQTAWDNLDEETQAAITSLSYNYGSLAELPSLVKAVRTGDSKQIAAAVKARSVDNGGRNSGRRGDEAALITSGPGGPMGQAPVPMPRSAASDARLAAANSKLAASMSKVFADAPPAAQKPPVQGLRLPVAPAKGSVAPGIVKTNSGIAGTAQMPPGARPSSIPAPSVSAPTVDETRAEQLQARAPRAPTMTPGGLPLPAPLETPAAAPAFRTISVINPEYAAWEAKYGDGSQIQTAATGGLITRNQLAAMQSLDGLPLPAATPPAAPAKYIQKRVQTRGTAPVAAPARVVVPQKTAVQRLKDQGMSSSQAYSAANAQARAAASKKAGGSGSGAASSSGNLGGVSSSGRRYDYDNNKWV